MKSKYKINVLLGLLFMVFAITVMPSNCFAENLLWKFKIPVEVENIPAEAGSVQAGVIVKIENKPSIARFSASEPIDANGSLTKMFKISIFDDDLPEGASPNDATAYRAFFMFKGLGQVSQIGSGFAPAGLDLGLWSLSTPVSLTQAPWAAAAPGTDAVVIAEGTL